MTTFYCDASALVKLYVSERGSQWMEVIAETGRSPWEKMNTLVTSTLGVVETSAAIARRARQGEIDTATQRKLYADIVLASESIYILVNVDDEIIYRASELTQELPLRGYDAVHLATALQFNAALGRVGLAPLAFVSADQALLEAARRLGLESINPHQMES